jgi:hypothetical protein
MKKLIALSLILLLTATFSFAADLLCDSYISPGILTTGTINTVSGIYGVTSSHTIFKESPDYMSSIGCMVGDKPFDGAYITLHSMKITPKLVNGYYPQFMSVYSHSFFGNGFFIDAAENRIYTLETEFQPSLGQDLSKFEKLETNKILVKQYTIAEGGKFQKVDKDNKNQNIVDEFSLKEASTWSGVGVKQHKIPLIYDSLFDLWYANGDKLVSLNKNTTLKNYHPNISSSIFSMSIVDDFSRGRLLFVLGSNGDYDVLGWDNNKRTFFSLGHGEKSFLKNCYNFKISFLSPTPTTSSWDSKNNHPCLVVTKYGGASTLTTIYAIWLNGTDLNDNNCSFIDWNNIDTKADNRKIVEKNSKVTDGELSYLEYYEIYENPKVLEGKLENGEEYKILKVGNIESLPVKLPVRQEHLKNIKLNIPTFFETDYKSVNSVGKLVVEENVMAKGVSWPNKQKLTQMASLKGVIYGTPPINEINSNNNSVKSTINYSVSEREENQTENGVSFDFIGMTGFHAKGTLGLTVASTAYEFKFLLGIYEKFHYNAMETKSCQSAYDYTLNTRIDNGNDPWAHDIGYLVLTTGFNIYNLYSIVPNPDDPNSLFTYKNDSDHEISILVSNILPGPNATEQVEYVPFKLSTPQGQAPIVWGSNEDPYRTDLGGNHNFNENIDYENLTEGMYSTGASSLLPATFAGDIVLPGYWVNAALNHINSNKSTFEILAQGSITQGKGIQSSYSYKSSNSSSEIINNELGGCWTTSGVAGTFGWDLKSLTGWTYSYKNLSEDVVGYKSTFSDLSNSYQGQSVTIQKYLLFPKLGERPFWCPDWAWTKGNKPWCIFYTAAPGLAM